MNDIELESQVANSLARLLTEYQNLDRLADEMLVPDLSPQLLDEKTIAMKMQRESIEQLELASRPLNEQYRASRDHASPAVKELTENLAGLMQKFLMKISALEKQAQHSYQALRPQFNNGVRAVQMKHAYKKYS